MTALFADKENRGLLSRIARQIDCQRSYLSRVANTDLHLTPDFAFKLAVAFKFSNLEQKYFLTLVDWERSGSLEFRNHLLLKLRKLKMQYEDLGQRTQRAPPPKSLDSVLYFSAWYWSAIHLLCSTTGKHSVESISKKLSLDPKLVQMCLGTLIEQGLLEKSGKEYKFKAGVMHVGKDSAGVINSSSYAIVPKGQWVAVGGSALSNLDAAVQTASPGWTTGS